MTIRLFVVTSNQNFLVALGRYIPTIESRVGHSIELIGAAFGMADARRDIAAHQPDLVLSDLGSPDSAVDGLAVTRWVQAMTAPPPVVLCSLYDDSVFQTASREAGGAGFLNKSELDNQLPALLNRLFP